MRQIAFLLVNVIAKIINELDIIIRKLTKVNIDIVIIITQ